MTTTRALDLIASERPHAQPRHVDELDATVLLRDCDRDRGHEPMLATGELGELLEGAVGGEATGQAESARKGDAPPKRK